MTLAQTTEPFAREQDFPIPEHWRVLGWKVAAVSAKDIAEIDASQWEGLSEKALEENPYLSRQYVLAGLETIDRGIGIRAVAISDETGRLVGLFPFKRRWGAAYSASNRYQFMGTPLIDRSRASTVLSAWLECLKRSELNSPVILRDIPLDGEFASRCKALAPAFGLTTIEASIYHRPRLTRRYASFQAHCDAVIPAQRRREVERAIRRISELGELRFERFVEPDLVRRYLEQFLSLELAGWKGRAGTAFGSRPETAEFARRAFGGEPGRDGLASIDGLFVDDRPVAFSINIAKGKTLFTPKGSYDETFRKFGPGLILEYLIVRHFYEDHGFDAMDSSTTLDGHVIQGLWNETARMGTFIVGRPESASTVAGLERCRDDVRDFARSLRDSAVAATKRAKQAVENRETRSAASAKLATDTTTLAKGQNRSPQNGPRRVLVIGDDMRIFLSVARSLGRAGLEVHAVPFDWHAPALQSKYVHVVHRMPRYGDDPAAWLNRFKELQRVHGFELVIPTCDRAIHPLNQHRDALADMRLAIPDAAAIPLLFDKEQTRQMCADLGIPTAFGDQLGGETAEELAARFGLPLIIKPRQSYWIDQLDTWGRVWIIDTIDELRSLLSQLPDRSRYLVESQFKGEGVGLSVLADKGQIRHAFQHRRLREGRGGSSSYRVSESVNPALLEAAGKVAKQIGLNGICMFEFRENPASGKWILLETNARFWGSMSLPVSLGCDFPLYLFDLLVDGRSHPAIDYRAGIRSRNLVLDGRNLLRSVTGRDRMPLRQLIGDIADFLGQPVRWVTGNERSDSIVRDDLAPAMAELTSVLSNIWRRREQAGRRRSDQRLESTARQ